MPVTARARDVADLSAGERGAMLALMRRCYDGVDEATFLRDLSDKSRVVVVCDSRGAIVGFSTLTVFAAEDRRGPLRALFSGDTVIAPEAWGSPAFSYAFVREAARIARAAPSPLYWLLIVKGHRTFRFLPAFTRAFAPCWRGDDPELLALRDRLALARFGAAYDPATGVLRRDGRDRLSPALAEPSPREAARADVAFFLARNPGYRRGDELVCLCRLAPDNLHPTARRLYESAA